MRSLSNRCQALWRRAVRGALVALAIVVADAVGVASAPAEAASATQLVGRILSDMVSTDARANESIRKSWGADVNAAQLAVLRPYIRAIFQSPQMAAYLTSRVEALGPIESLTQNEVVAATANAMLDLQTSGMRRLPADLQTGYLRYVRTMYGELSEQECYDMVDPNTTAMRMAEIERMYVKRLSIPKLTDYLRLLERAMVAELNDYPPVPSMNAERARLAQGAFERALGERMRDPQAALAMLRMSNLQAGSICPGIQVTVDAMLSLAEPYRSWYFQVFMEMAR